MSETKKNSLMQEFFGDWKIHAICIVLVLIAELIGTKPFKFPITEGFSLAFSLFPMLYVLVIGMVLGIFKLISMDTMVKSSPYIGISVMWLTVKQVANVGPNLGIIVSAGPALLLQKLGHVAPVLLAMPLALFVFNMGRQAVGATFSTSREGSIAIVGAMYGLDSPEGQGVMGAYITGTLIGTIFCAIMGGLIVGLNIFHPYALAMGSGVGSASMMTAYLAPLLEAYPNDAGEINAFVASSQLVGSVVNMYLMMFISLPIGNWMYKTFKGQERFERAEAKRIAKGKENKKATAAPVAKSEPAPAASATVSARGAQFDYWFPRVKILLISGVYATIGNYIASYKSTGGENPTMPWTLASVMLLMMGIILLGCLIDTLAKKHLKWNLPTIIYISILGTIFSIPGVSPFADLYVNGANKIPLLPLCTPVLAYAGLSLGKDWEDFKNQGLKIIGVACCTFFTIYIASVIIAQIMLTITGQI